MDRWMDARIGGCVDGRVGWGREGASEAAHDACSAARPAARLSPPLPSALFQGSVGFPGFPGANGEKGGRVRTAWPLLRRLVLLPRRGGISLYMGIRGYIF